VFMLLTVRPRPSTPPLAILLLLAWLLGALSPLAQAQTKPKSKLAVAAATPATSPLGNALLGRDKADAERCVECHGPLGQGAEHSNGPEGNFAKLAGQHPDYLIKQLMDFRSGARKHDVMSLMAKSVEPADLRDIVAFFSSQARAQGDGSGDTAAARSLYLQGDAARGVPACASCHGEQALGVAGAAGRPPVPLLAGQEYLYLERQLLDWRSGWRANSPGGVMNPAVAPLSEAEVKALAGYLSGLR
jgi:cytochrome c553